MHNCWHNQVIFETEHHEWHRKNKGSEALYTHLLLKDHTWRFLAIWNTILAATIGHLPKVQRLLLNLAFLLHNIIVLYLHKSPSPHHDNGLSLFFMTIIYSFGLFGVKHIKA